MLTNSLKKIVAWLPFALGLGAGLALAFLIYAGLQPRLRKAVLAQQAQAAKTAASAPAGTAPGPAARPAAGALPAVPPRAATAPAAESAAGEQSIAQAVRLTTLAPTASTAHTASPNPWPAMLLLMAAALAAAGAAWQQFRRQPQPPGAITSLVLEALFTLSAHRDMLQKTLALSPRQIKRFSSKARVQHSQLRALARPSQHQQELPFSVDNQVKAFQILLLLEENRRQSQRFSQHDVEAFISQVHAAYIGHPELTTALLEAYANPVISAAKSKEAFVSVPDPIAEQRLLRQLFELNAGLLA